VWSAERSGELEEALGVGFDAVVSERVPVRLQSRNTEYWVARGTMRPLAQR
jgi:hypothetical protein